MQIDRVASEIAGSFPLHVGEVWEELARASVSRLNLFGHSWRPASCWWGSGLDRKPMELDVIAESDDGSAILLGEAKWSRDAGVAALVAGLRRKAERFPNIRSRKVFFALWLKQECPTVPGVEVITPSAVLASLR
jgi:hypothetical protein